MTEFIAIILALAIGYIVWLHRKATAPEEISRLQKQIKDAERTHSPTKELRRRLVMLRVEQLRGEG